MILLIACLFPVCYYFLSLLCIRYLGCVKEFYLARGTLWNFEMLIFCGEWILGPGQSQSWNRIAFGMSATAYSAYSEPPSVSETNDLDLHPEGVPYPDYLHVSRLFGVSSMEHEHI